MGTTSATRDRLLSWRNADGGWPYVSGKSSRLEPTCLALLAAGIDDAWAVLQQWPRQGGVMVDRAGLPPNYAFNGLALLTLLHTSGQSPAAEALARNLVDAKGLAVDGSEVVRLDTRLQAWSWVDGTFSWVEPTAWCLLALKKWRGSGPRPDLEARVDEAERLLVDRACDAGGWNYGNSMVFATELPSYVPTTALALLAMQDQPQLAVVKKGVERLEQRATSEPSSLSLGLALIALRVFGRPIGAVESALAERVRVAESMGQIVGLATALYALRHEEHGCASFRL